MFQITNLILLKDVERLEKEVKRLREDVDSLRADKVETPDWIRLDRNVKEYLEFLKEEKTKARKTKEETES